MTDTTTRYLLVTLDFPADVDVDSVITTFDSLDLSPMGMVADVIDSLIPTVPFLLEGRTAQVYPGDVIAPEAVPDPDPPRCGATAAQCVCVLPADHPDAHECDPGECTGSWTGSIEADTFEVVRFPFPAETS